MKKYFIFRNIFSFSFIYQVQRTDIICDIRALCKNNSGLKKLFKKYFLRYNARIPSLASVRCAKQIQVKKNSKNNFYVTMHGYNLWNPCVEEKQIQFKKRNSK